jgi:hypothetical protein
LNQERPSGELVLSASPYLLRLTTAVALLFRALPMSKRVGVVTSAGETTVTFSDALCAVHRWLWAEAALPRAQGRHGAPETT